MISIDLSETTQKMHWKSETKFSLRQNSIENEVQSETKSENLFSDNFFFATKYFLGFNFVSD